MHGQQHIKLKAMIYYIYSPVNDLVYMAELPVINSILS